MSLVPAVALAQLTLQDTQEPVDNSEPAVEAPELENVSPTPATTPITHHCGCGVRWTGRNRAHCSVCHRTFSGSAGFDRHRRNDTCLDPATVTNNAGQPVYRSEAHHGGVLWLSAERTTDGE